VVLGDHVVRILVERDPDVVAAASSGSGAAHDAINASVAGSRTRRLILFRLLSFIGLLRPALWSEIAAGSYATATTFTISPITWFAVTPAALAS
jgi:hypothetical protein